MTIKAALLGCAAILIVAPAIAIAQDAPAPAVSEPDPEPMKFGGWGFNPADLDPSVKPGDDFDAYVNGKWKAATEIPSKYPFWGVYVDLDLQSERAVKGIIDDIKAKQNAPGSL